MSKKPNIMDQIFDAVARLQKLTEQLQGLRSLDKDATELGMRVRLTRGRKRKPAPKLEGKCED